jgi:hypothetical protein
MMTWQDLSAAEQRVLDSVSEDYTQLWELGVPVTMHGRDKTGQKVRRELPPIPQDEVRRAIHRLLDLGLVELVRRRGLDDRAPIAPAEHAAVLTDPESWRPGGVVEVVATDTGRQLWLS